MFLLLLSILRFLLPILLACLCRANRHTPRIAGGAHHMKRAVQKQNACISDN
ncbi:hypothetical protein [Paraburkholderia sp. ZP32-5]|uniref:hypothetical protein n=1 Tax=Paraburkholderia sp. ZP32-5 TaxID=2883245 RepID=UPI001F314E61|nr:hypothetical protein [Paraburkholderia sp. ZP32-5]